jgi:glycosyltransferase involved in cell wall biosynthesis
MAETLGGNEHEVWVLAVDKGEGEVALQAAKVALVPSYGKRLPRNIFGWGMNYLAIAANMLRVVRRIRPDVIQAEDADALPLAWLASRLFGCRLVYDAKELRIDSGNGVPQRLGKYVEGLFVRRAGIVIAANHIRADYMKQYYSLKSTPVVIRNQPLQSKPVHASDRLPNFLNQQNILATKVVLYQGGIIPGRGLDILVKAMTLVPKNVALVFLGGESPYRALLQAEVQRLHLEARVAFMDFVPPGELLDVIAAADLGVVLYQKANLNNYMCASTKQYEYVSAGVPVLMPDFPHLVEFLEKYDTGVSCDSSDHHSIAGAICAGLDKYPRSPELSARLMEIRQWEDWEKDGSLLRSAYKALG